MPALVVAMTGKPAATIKAALPGSQALGRTIISPERCWRQKASAWSRQDCVTLMGVLLGKDQGAMIPVTAPSVQCILFRQDISFLDDMKLDEIRALVSIAQLGGVTRAAGNLNRSQPAVSRRIRQLEEA